MDEMLLKNKALVLEIINQFASQSLTGTDSMDNPYCRFCKGCEDMDEIDYWHHEDDCIVMRARALQDELNRQA